MNLAKEIDTLYNLVARDETEDGLERLLFICKQWDLPIKNEVIALSNKFHAHKKVLQAGEEVDDTISHRFNITFLEFLDKIRLDEMLGMKSLNQLVGDLNEMRILAVELEQKLWEAKREIRKLKNDL